jgi:hypothetical protein
MVNMVAMITQALRACQTGGCQTAVLTGLIGAV